MASVNIITMGCSKNFVDSQSLARLMGEAGLDVYLDNESPHHDFLVVNTCGFIGDAKEESIEMIMNCIGARDRGQTRGVYVMGCLSERYRKDLPAEMPEVDGWYGKFDWKGLAQELAERVHATPGAAAVKPPVAVTQFIKISEGCNRFCAFCAIPLITGRLHSRPIEEIVAEVTDLAARGAREFNIIAQDLSAYGLDLYGEHRLAQLIDRLADVPGVEWLRLHYAYPADFPMDVLDVMARRPNVCKYLDIALQHSSDKMLEDMRRNITAKEQEALLREIRARVPGIHLRTTLMVGFPGETQSDFDQLLHFVESQRFERLGAFAYCEEEDTYAARHLKDDVDADTKQERLDLLMDRQHTLAFEHNQNMVGETLKVLITNDEYDEYYVARSQYDSPDVDPEVLIYKDTVDVLLEVGHFYNVVITDCDDLDLIAELADD